MKENKFLDIILKETKEVGSMTASAVLSLLIISVVLDAFFLLIGVIK